jgi:ribose transport system substrate-binding protein
VAETDAGFDATKQIEGVESMIPLKPDVLIAAPVDQVTGAAAFQPAVDAGIKLAFVSNIPEGYVHGRDFIGNATANVYDGYITNCELARELLGEGGKIGLIVWSVDYWYANYCDNLVVENIEDYGLEVVDTQGFVTPDDAYNVATSMILRYPDIEGFFITYMVPAMSVATACVDANRPDLKVITGAYDKPTLLNMARGGNIAGISTDATYLVGINSVLLAAYGLLGKTGPEYAVCPYIPFTLENMREIWKIGMRTPLPDYLDEALSKLGY